MTSRWTVLALLFAVRLTMAFQFQAVAALSPVMMDRLGLSLADLGLLVGLYLSPGIVFALPGGAVGQRLGEKRVVAAGMVLMIAGGAVMALWPAWEAQVTGRVLAGIGGAILNVLLTKMVTDWFAGRELATAMGIFVNSWPVGIALALLVLPPVAGAAGLSAALWLVPALVALGLAALLIGYRAPAAASPARVSLRAPMARTALAGAVVAGTVWGLFNGALAIVFSFGPALLAGRGWTGESASAATSVVLWTVAVTTPVGGWLADRTGRPRSVIAVKLAGFAVLMAVAAQTQAVVAAFAALGLFVGLAPGVIMSLPAAYLSPHDRALGMGICFTIYYAGIVVAPILAGLVAEAADLPEAAFYFGAALPAICLLLLASLRLIDGRTSAVAD